MKMALLNPGLPLQSIDIEPGQARALVGGEPEFISIGPPFVAMIHDRGILLGLSPNLRFIRSGQLLVGPLVINRVDDYGNDVSLRPRDLELIETWIARDCQRPGRFHYREVHGRPLIETYASREGETYEDVRARARDNARGRWFAPFAVDVEDPDELNIRAVELIPAPRENRR